MLPTMMMERDDSRAIFYPPEGSETLKMYAKEKVQPSNQQPKIQMPPMDKSLATSHDRGKLRGEIKYNDWLSSSSQQNLSPLRSTVEPVPQDNDRKEPSCPPQNPLHRTKQSRSSSFCYRPSLRSLLREQTNRRSLPSIKVLRESRVTFQDHVDVVPVESLKDSPDEVRRKLWMSDDELAVSMRQAEKQEMKKQRDRLIESLLLHDNGTDSDSQGDLQSPSRDDSTTEEEGSMEFTDLILSDSLDEESQEVLEAMDRMAVSR